MRVLVIEDDPTVAMLLSAELRYAGADVHQWLRDFDQLFTGIEWADVDAVVCDWELGEGWTGSQVLEWLEANHPDVRRVMLTGSISAEAVEQHAHKVLVKPVAPDMLLDALGIADG